MKEKVFRVSCDRCKSVFEEGDKPIEGASSVQFQISGTLVAQAIKSESLVHEDLCNPCKKRLVDIIKSVITAGRGRKPGGKNKPKPSGRKDKKPNSGSSDHPPAAPPA